MFETSLLSLHSQELSHVGKVLEARETRMVDMSRENITLMEANQSLQKCVCVCACVRACLCGVRVLAYMRTFACVWVCEMYMLVGVERSRHVQVYGSTCSLATDSMYV